MADEFYADPTVVTLGPKFSTNFRFLRRATVSPLVTYLQAGPTFTATPLNGNNGNPKVWAYSCATYQIRNTYASNTSAYPSNSVTNVAL